MNDFSDIPRTSLQSGAYSCPSAPNSRFIVGGAAEGGTLSGYRRWSHHNYAGWGYYMITFSTEPRRPILSRIENYQAIPTPCGDALKAAWLKMAEECPQISLREYAIMPDHFHGIVTMKPGSDHPLGWWVRRV